MSAVQFVRTIPPKPLNKYAIVGLLSWASWKQAMVLSSTAESFQGLSKAFRSMAPSADIAIRYFFEFEQTDLDAHDLDPRVLVTAGLIRGCNDLPFRRTT